MREMTYQNMDQMQQALAAISLINGLLQERKLSHTDRNHVDRVIGLLAAEGLKYNPEPVNPVVNSIPF